MRVSLIMVRSFVILSELLLTACAHRYYAVDYGFFPRDVLPPAESSQLREEQLEVLAKARTVAFAPPSECKEIALGVDNAASSVNLARTNCGVLMSELEAAAQDAGFTVVSWRAIKEPVHQNAVQHGVDLLIEVSRLDIPILEKKEFLPRTIRIFEAFPDRTRKKVIVDQLLSEVAPRCIEHAPEIDFGEYKYGIVAILDAKVTDAHTGNIITRQVHMSPSASDQVQLMTQYYRGGEDEKPAKVLCSENQVGTDWQVEKKQARSINQEEDKGSAINVFIKKDSDKGGILPSLIHRVSRNMISRIVAIRDIYRASRPSPLPDRAAAATASKKADAKRNPHLDAKRKSASQIAQFSSQERKEFADQLNRAEALIDKSKFEDARNILTQLAMKQNTNARVQFFLGKIYYMKNDETAAVAHLNSAISFGLADSNLLTQAKCWIKDFSSEPCNENSQLSH